jgi:outer membrane protein assembly factor BamB
MLPVIFCPDCQTYLGLQADACPACGRARLASECLPEPQHPLWQGQVGGPVHSAVIAGDLVIFNTGASGQPGGVYAFHRERGEPRWSFPSHYPVEAGASLFQDRLYFGTCGFVYGGAELVCLRAVDGTLIWKRELTGGIWSAPVVDEARVYVGLDDGQVLCFDNRTGMPLCNQPVGLPRGRVWLERLEHDLIALSNKGQVLVLNPMGLESLWPAPVDVGMPITSPPCSAAGHAFFGCKDGQMMSLDLRTRKVNRIARVPGNIVSAPACFGEVLYFGAVGQDTHYLYAFDGNSIREIWSSPDLGHSLCSQPFAAGDLVVAAVAKTGMVLLEARTGALAWIYPVETEAHMFSHPVLSRGVIYAGDDQGKVFALPWHLGKYEWAARIRQARNELVEAGTFYVLAAQHVNKASKKEEFYQQAVDCWHEDGRMELAGHLWEGLVEEEKAAEAYKEAGRLWTGKDNQRAAEYYNLAAQLYHQLDDETKENNCAQIAQKLALGPLLRIKLWTNPRMTQYEEGQITFRLENIGKKNAVNLSLNLGGSLLTPVTFQVVDPLPAGADSYFDVTLSIAPTRAQNELVIQAEYQTPTGQRNFFSTCHAIIEAEEAPDVIEMKDVVALRGIQITNPLNRRIRIKMDSVIAPHIGIEDS